MGRGGRGVPARGATNCDWEGIKMVRVVSSREFLSRRRRVAVFWLRLNYYLINTLEHIFYYRFIILLTGPYGASKEATHAATFGYFAHPSVVTNTIAAREAADHGTYATFDGLPAGRSSLRQLRGTRSAFVVMDTGRTTSQQ